jgi:xanthine dehydrogenase YagS FAD-binding subunit
MLPAFKYVRPTTLAAASELLASPEARAHGGGADLLGCLRNRVFDVTTVVGLGGLVELKGITPTKEGGLRIGALTTIRGVATDERISARWPALSQAAAVVASPQLREQGTVGGNLCQKPRCWYYRGDFHCLRKGGETCFAWDGENQYHCILGGDRCHIVHPSDLAPALVALDAVAEIRGRRGVRLVPVERLHVPPSTDPQRETVLAGDEILTAVLLPGPPAGQRSSFRKVRARAAWDFALASVALALRTADGKVAEAHVVLGGVAPVPWRSHEAEAALAGKPLDHATAAAAAAAAVAKAQPLAHNAYKVALVRSLLADELEAIARS